MEKQKYNEILFGAGLGLICSIIGALILSIFQSTQINKNTVYSVFEELQRNKALINLEANSTKDYVPLETSAWEISKAHWNKIDLTPVARNQITSCYTLIHIYNAQLLHTERNLDNLEGNMKALTSIIEKTLELMVKEKRYLKITIESPLSPSE